MKKTDVPKLKAAFGHWLQAMQSDVEPRRQVTRDALHRLGVFAAIVEVKFDPRPARITAMEAGFANWLNAIQAGTELDQRRTHETLYGLGVLVALADVIARLQPQAIPAGV